MGTPPSGQYWWVQESQVDSPSRGGGGGSGIECSYSSNQRSLGQTLLFEEKILAPSKESSPKSPRHTIPRETAKDYDLSDWNLIEIDKALDFNYHPDYTELLKDRACSYPLSMFDYIC